MHKLAIATLTLLAGSAVAPARSQLAANPTNNLYMANCCCTASASQTGSGNQARIAQTGRGNVATVVQQGRGNRAFIRQSGTVGAIKRVQEGNQCETIVQQSDNAAGHITIRRGP